MSLGKWKRSIGVQRGEVRDLGSQIKRAVSSLNVTHIHWTKRKEDAKAARNLLERYIESIGEAHQE